MDGRSPVEPLLNALASELGANVQTIARVRQRLGAIGIQFIINGLKPVVIEIMKSV